MIFLTLLLHVTCAWAQVGSSTDALGGAAIGNSHALDSGWTNPAALAEVEGVVAGAQFFNGTVASGVDLRQYGITITDGSTGAFPGAAGYKHRTYTVGGKTFSEYMMRFSAAIPIQHQLSVGFSGYRVHTNAFTNGAMNQDNGDLGVYWRASKKLSLGAVTRALFGSKDNAFLPSKVRPTGGLGAEYDLLDFLRLRMDLLYPYEDNPDSRIQTNMGLEIRNMQYVSLRFGYNNDEFRKEDRFTAGFAWDGPKLRLGYSYQKEVRQKLGESHTIDIWLGF
jgi:hypothetical protein